MHSFRKSLVALVGLLVLVAAPAAQADPLTFSNVLAIQSHPTVPNTNVTTDLFASPNAILTNGTHVTFFVDVTGTLLPGGNDTLRFTIGLPDGSTVVLND